jgi:hypothetical protein
VETTIRDKIISAQKENKGIVHIKEKVPKVPELCQLILDEAHLIRFSIHPGSNKIYHDLKQRFWWTKMKIEIARYISKCDTCQRVKAVHLKSAGELQPLPIPS